MKFTSTRLLYVGNTDDQSLLRLTLSTEIDEVKYIALSHRWGSISEDDVRQYCTTQDNISDRLNGLSISDLPKTFRDAVAVTRELGVQYL